jgi:hypothetical protein
LETLEAISHAADRRKGYGSKIRREIKAITTIVRDYFRETFQGVRVRRRRECQACGMLGAVFFKCERCAGLLCDNCRNMAGNHGRPLCSQCQEAEK